MIFTSKALKYLLFTNHFAVVHAWMAHAPVWTQNAHACKARGVARIGARMGWATCADHTTLTCAPIRTLNVACGCIVQLGTAGNHESL